MALSPGCLVIEMVCAISLTKHPDEGAGHLVQGWNPTIFGQDVRKTGSEPHRAHIHASLHQKVIFYARNT